MKINKGKILSMIGCVLFAVFCLFTFTSCKKNNVLQFIVDGEEYYTIETNGKEEITLPTDPEKKGYVFAGWYHDEFSKRDQLTSSYYLEKEVKGTIVIYGKFDCINYEITYVVDGGTHRNRPTYTVEDSFILRDATKEGFTFEGWYMGDTKVEEIPLGSTSDMTLVAKWTITEFTVTFKDENGIIEVVRYPYGATSIVEPIFPERPGYGGVWEEYELNNTNIVVRARYWLTHYGITFIANDSIVDNTSYTIETEEIHIPALPKKEGYIGKWSDFTLGMSDIRVYAIYTPIEYTATFIDGDKTLGTALFTLETVAIDEPALPTKEGYNSSWSEYTISPKDLTISVIYTVITYKITYTDEFNVSHNNPTTYTIESEDIRLAKLTKENFIFNGWYKDTEKIERITKGTIGDIDLVASWTPYILTIDYDKTRLAVKTTDVIDGELFNVSCEDNLDNTDIKVTVTYSGDLVEGARINIILTATSKGTTETVIIEDIKVLGTPTVKSNGGDYLYQDDNLDLLFTGFDSCNDIIPVTYSISGNMEEGSTVEINATTTDILNNSYSKAFTYTVLGKKEGLFTSYGNTISGLTGNGFALTKIMIPYELNGTVITTIGTNAFRDNDLFTYVELPNSITEISNSAFNSSQGLEKIKFNEGLTSIGMFAFASCISLTEIEFPSTLTSIGLRAFQNCDKLKEIVLHENIDYVGDWAFARCDLLKEITIENSNIDLRGNVFSENTNLTTISFPDGMKIIPASTFSTCSTLEEIKLPNGITTIGDSSFFTCVYLRTIFIPKTVTTIEASAFASALSLVILCEETEAQEGWNSSWNSSGRPVYYGVTDATYLNDGTLEYVVQNGSAIVVRVNKDATTVVIPSLITIKGISYPVTTIGHSAFMGSTSLKSVTIPNTIVTIEASAFESCPSLSIYCEANETQPGWDSEWASSTKTIYYGVNNTNYYNDGTFEYILSGQEAMISKVVSDAKHITIPSTIKVNDVAYTVSYLLTNVFRNLPNLTSIYIPKEIIPPYMMLSGDESLAIYCEATSFTGYPTLWYNSVSVAYFGITQNSYYYDGKLEYIVQNGEASVSKADQDIDEVVVLSSITIGNNTYPVTKIEQNAFYGCKFLTDVTIPDSVITIESGAFENCSSLVNIRIPNTLQQLGEYAFAGCTSLQDINIDSRITKINAGTFYGSGLKYFFLPTDVLEIGESAFESCDKLEIVFIPNNVSVIGKDAFANTTLAKIFCEASFVPTGWDTDWNPSLRPVIWAYNEAIIYNDGILQYEIRSDGNAYVISADASVTIIDIPSTVTYDDNTYSVVGIGKRAFENYNNLVIVNIPNSVSIIEEYAFSNCKKLRTVFIPESVAIIGANAFNRCSRLTINCATSEAQPGWDEAWNPLNITVVYNYGKDQN